MAVHVIDEADRCLQCKKPMCQQGCPIHTPIPAMIKALKEGGLEDAGAMLFANNPMSLVCSLVYNHERQCEGHCVLGRKGQPVHVSSIENYISDTCLERIKIDCAPKNGNSGSPSPSWTVIRRSFCPLALRSGPTPPSAAPWRLRTCSATDTRVFSSAQGCGVQRPLGLRGSPWAMSILPLITWRTRMHMIWGIRWQSSAWAIPPWTWPAP